MTHINQHMCINRKGDDRCVNISYRKAHVNESPILAEFTYYASEGLLDYMFNDTIPDLTVTQLLTFGFEDESRYNSYKGVFVAECNGRIAGMIQAYSGKHHEIDDEMRSIIPGERLEQLGEFYGSRIDNSFLINAMYVDEKCRRRGIASRLMALVRDEAKSCGFDKLCLFVFADNLPAQKLYEGCGFKTVKNIAFNDSAILNHDRGICLMSCDI